jgi:hypothetical protein
MGGFVLLAGGILIGILLGRFLFPPAQPAPVEVTRKVTQLVTYIPETVAETPEVPITSLTGVSTEVPVIPPPLETPFPSDTHEPSITSTITPVPPLFEDSFEAGLSDDWTLVYGDVDIVDGNLVARESTMLMVGREDWSNYHIQAEVSSPDCWLQYGINAIGVLASDFDNMIAFAWADCQRVIYEVIDGQWESVPGTSKGRPGGVSFETFDIYVEGNSITVYDNNQKLVSYVADRDQGMVALRLDAETQATYFRVDPIP